MKLVVTKHAANWLIKQARLQAGDLVAIYAQKDAGGQVALNYRKAAPSYAVATDEHQGVTFYVDFAKEWFFSGKVTTVDFQDGKLTYQQVRETPDEQPVPVKEPASTKADASTAASRKYEEYWE